MRFHLLALPNTQTTREYSLDGFSQATIRFARILKDLGHTVFLYASEENEAPCDELITVIKKEEIDTLLGVNDTPYQYAYIEAWSPIWQLANARMIKEIARRKQPHDFICLIGGASQKPVTDSHPDLLAVEYSIGYEGSFAPFRVFESRVWQHRTYGIQGIVDGRFFDTVIPIFFDPEEFTFRSEKESFALYAGRLIPRKGVEIACRAAEAAGIPLKIIGHGDKSLVTRGAEYLGALPAAERNDWMSRASVVMCPTQYIEPFNCVAVESQLCGTPVVSTDFGGFVETVEHGKTGFRCSYLGEFIKGIKDAPGLNSQYIRDRAVREYSMHNLKHQYQKYFERLSLLWKDGWDTQSC
jgi:glycosyltransferase involved in cell wall biosynthesis